MPALHSDYEYVSALMDGEDLSEEALNKLLSDDNAAAIWREFHIVRDGMGKQGVPAVDFTADADFRAELAKISAEHRQNSQSVQHNAQTGEPAKASNQAFRGFAVAASVAAVAVSVWQFWPQANPDEASSVAAVEAPAETAQKTAPAKAVPAATNQAASAVQTQAAPVVPEQETDEEKPAQQSAARVERINPSSGKSEQTQIQ